MMRPTTLALAGSVLALTVAGCGIKDPLKSTTDTADPVPTTTVATPPVLSSAEVNSQDRFTTREKRRHEQAHDSRPLLRRLPLSIDGVSIDVAGLAADNKTTILRVVRGRHTPKEARTAYRRALRRAHDTGNAYTPRYVR
jgi:hypothetical protein